jgi:hypothetical protein
MRIALSRNALLPWLVLTVSLVSVEAAFAGSGEFPAGQGLPSENDSVLSQSAGSGSEQHLVDAQLSDEARSGTRPGPSQQTPALSAPHSSGADGLRTEEPTGQSPNQATSVGGAVPAIIALLAIVGVFVIGRRHIPPGDDSAGSP